MRGLLIKSFYETWPTTLLFGSGLALATALLTFVLPQIQGDFADVLASMPFVTQIVQALFGIEIDQMNAEIMQAILWVHPVVLTLVWAHEIVICTRVPAGEIDRGTVDVLLGLPISRRAIYATESVAWLISGAFVLALGLCGHLAVANILDDESRPPISKVCVILVNLYSVYLAVGGLTWLASAISDRRGRAMGTAFAVVLASFLLNFLAQFWQPAQQLAFLSVLEYYQPAQVITSGEMPWGDIAVLLVVAVCGWTLGNEAFARRSICTV